MTSQTSIGRRVAPVAVMLLLGGMAAWWSIDATRNATEGLVRSQIENAEFQTKIREIQRLSNTEPVVALRPQSANQIGRQIASAMQTASIDPSAMRSTTPMAPVRIDRTDFQNRKTEVRFASVTLPQALAFCAAVVDGVDGLIVSDLRLSMPRGNPQTGDSQSGNPQTGDSQTDETLERWDVELILTQRVYSPIADRPRR